jgi:CheY-like chemotaxis protein
MGKRVMIVEDSRAIRKILEVMLRREEIEAESYGDAYTALQTLQDLNHPIPAVVLLDLGLPAVNQITIDGYTFARLLRTQPRFDATAIIVLSGHDDMLTRLRARHAGARAYLSKPFKTQQVITMVRQYLALASNDLEAYALPHFRDDHADIVSSASRQRRL